MSPPSRDEESAAVPPHSPYREKTNGHNLPRFSHDRGKAVTPGVPAEGESGRRGFHPWQFLRICFRSTSRLSMMVNILWPFVPAAIALRYARPDEHLWIFILNYIAMVPAANLIGFAGQELARKIPKVFGTLLEVTIGSVVEIILFMVLISKGNSSVQIIRAAILGSILANLLLCLGMCFLAGGLLREDQKFHEIISETGNGLMLVAGMALVIPSVFSNAVSTSTNAFESQALSISRGTAIMLLVGFLIYVWFQLHSHHGLIDEVFERDELRDADRRKDLAKEKLTFTECFVALAIAVACVTLHAIFLVKQIHYIVEERHISDAFVGLILVPLVEKAAEHLTAIDEAWDNQMNFAISHVLGASIQTALLNTPLVVIVGWGLGYNMDLNFEMFDSVVLILAILVVGNFLRDGKSNYLEGVLCVIVYIVIAISAYYYPNPEPTGSSGAPGHEGASAETTSSAVAHLVTTAAGAAATHAARILQA